ncbi:transcriptional regulator [Siphonobacter sp. BAB-5385]|uniref:XRE family transcriptional regulator n=1 Tax=Siphonobacter curvatus TaxID=2094562 RepID=A0A2S7IHS6_9BACT|nr:MULTISPECIES: helix-turn-helix transcriptional regulator [Siphonobacter]OZI07279.1 transcriptional regulator [Siphonobacter sp. BAB-5385]PMD90377.1 transcriptional regulator [Siphonobacter sp. BAB-5405]PQA55109.1 XRE family transcriptional regulator [Siphonobacter curvatus]
MTTTNTVPAIELLTTRAISLKIRKLREIYSYSQEYVAFQMGISQAAYSKKESGRTELSLLCLGKLSEIYQVSLMDLIGLSTQELLMKVLQTNASLAA